MKVMPGMARSEWQTGGACLSVRALPEFLKGLRMKQTFHRIFKIREGRKKESDFHALFLYRTYWGFPLVNKTDRRFRGKDGQFGVITSRRSESKLIVQKCNEWLQTHMFENEEESLDYRAVKHVVKYLSPGGDNDERAEVASDYKTNKRLKGL